METNSSRDICDERRYRGFGGHGRQITFLAMLVLGRLLLLFSIIHSAAKMQNRDFTWCTIGTLVAALRCSWRREVAAHWLDTYKGIIAGL